MKSKVMNHDFAKVPSLDLPRSVFQRNHDRHQTLNAGYLYPMFVDEILPGDTCTLSQQLLIRQQTPIAPFMDNLYADTFWFFVPNRLVWTNWVKFQGEQLDPDDSTSFTIPQVVSPAGGFGAKSLFDYFGINPELSGANTTSVNALPTRCYNLIWNQWFRDQNLQDPVVVDTDDGPDTVTDYVLKRRGKRHDYLTSCLPFAQKGDAVSVPLGTRARVAHDQTDTNSLGVWSTVNSAYKTMGTAASNLIASASASTEGAAFYADLSDATASTINELRQAFAVQQILELDARGGTRYVESLKARWGVTSPDFRLQRPEYIGGNSIPINVHQVAQTSSTDATTPQGNLAAFAIGSGGENVFTYSATEHGYILGLVSIRADLRYQQNIEKMWTRSTRYDFFEPSLAHLGEQAVLNKEIYATGAAADNDVFGYAGRFDEYRYKQSTIAGEFRSSYATPLDMWHLSQNFSSLPALDSTFIEENPPINRISAITTQDYFKMDAYFNYRHARVMPIYSVPGLKRL